MGDKYGNGLMTQAMRDAVARSTIRAVRVPRLSVGVTTRNSRVCSWRKRVFSGRRRTSGGSKIK